MEEFSELELEQIINSALGPSSNSTFSYLGLGETDILSYVYDRLSYKVTGSDLNSIFQDLRSDLLSRKISLNIKELHTITSNCRKCKIDVSPELPKWNVNNPDVAIVIESPSISSEGINLMISAFKEAGFTSDMLCLTYVNRCPIKRKFEQQEITNCIPYLHSEIQLLNPKLTVCLGALPSSVLFGSPIKIKDVRGQIRWLGNWPILSTYAPMYIIKSGGSSPEHFFSDIKNAYNFINSSRNNHDT